MKENFRNKRVSYNRIADFLLVISFFLYTYRGNLGALVAIGSMVCRLLTGKIRSRQANGITAAWALYFGVFAVILYFIRNTNVEFYVAVAYICVIFNLFMVKQINFGYIIKAIYAGSFLISLSMWFQFLLPGVYTQIARIIFPSQLFSNVMQRMSRGYVNGFTREVALAALVVVVGLLYAFYFEKGKKRWFWICFFAVTLLLTGKKAHPVFLLAAIFLTYYFRTKNIVKHMKIWVAAGVLLFLIIITFPLWRNISFVNRIVAFIEGVQYGLDLNALSSGRMVIYERALQLWSEEKWWGIGWENFRNIGAYGSSEYTTWFKNYDVHNCYLQILCETGIVGAIVFGGILLGSIGKSINTLRKSNDLTVYFSFSYFVFFSLYAITEPCLFQESYFILLCLCLGILLSFNLKKSYSRSTNNGEVKYDYQPKRLP